MGASPASLLPYALSVCGLAEIGDFATAGITHALSILDPGWPDPGRALPGHRQRVKVPLAADP